MLAWPGVDAAQPASATAANIAASTAASARAFKALLFRLMLMGHYLSFACEIGFVLRRDVSPITAWFEPPIRKLAKFDTPPSRLRHACLMGDDGESINRVPVRGAWSTGRWIRAFWRPVGLFRFVSNMLLSMRIWAQGRRLIARFNEWVNGGSRHFFLSNSDVVHDWPL